jgi:hypothetical protein
MNLNIPSSMNRRSFDRPWLFFFLFCASNALLAYGHCSLTLKLFIVFYGLLLPFGLLVWSQTENRKILSETGLLSPPNWVFWLVLILVLLFTRFYRIDSNPLWPIKDVGYFDIFGLSLWQKWDWRLLWGECQSEPLYAWGLGLFFKLTDPSGFSSRIFPALLSILTLGFAYGAARQYWDRGFSFLFLGFFMLSFANWSFSRTGIVGITLWPVEFLALGLLAWVLGHSFRSPLRESAAWGILGAVSGLGFYSYASWPVVFLAVACALFWKTFQTPSKFPSFFSFLLGTCAVALPMGLAHLGQKGIQHYQEEFLQIPLSQGLPAYLKLLFWNGEGNQPDGPAWGGMFNPVESGLMAVGLARLAAGWKSAFSKWFFLSGALFLLPGILSNIIGRCHVIQLLPLLMIPLMAGIAFLLSRVSSARRWWIAVMLISASAALNAYHWWGPYQDWKSIPAGKSDWISGEYASAYDFLKKTSDKEGPGYLFTRFHLDTVNGTLSFFCFPFNALENPKMNSITPGWAALVADKYYVPFLQKRFPRSRWYLLKNDDLPNDMNLALGYLPMDSQSQADWNRWKAANEASRDLDLAMRKDSPTVTNKKFREQLLKQYPLFSGDPFLRDYYWEMMNRMDAVLKDDSVAVQDIEIAIKDGYPAAHLYYTLSSAQKNIGLSVQSEDNRKKAMTAWHAFTADNLLTPLPRIQN